MKKYKTEKKAGVLSCFQNRKILFVLAYACIFQIVLGCYGSFIGVVVTDMGYDNAMIGRLMCVSALSELPVLLCIRFLMRKVKIEYLLLTAGAAMTVRIWLPLTGSIAFIFLGQALQGMTYMIMYYGCVMFMDQNFPREHRGTGQVPVLYGAVRDRLHLQQYRGRLAGRTDRPDPDLFLVWPDPSCGDRGLRRRYVFTLPPGSKGKENVKI